MSENSNKHTNEEETVEITPEAEVTVNNNDPQSAAPTQVEVSPRVVTECSSHANMSGCVAITSLK